MLRLFQKKRGVFEERPLQEFKHRELSLIDCVDPTTEEIQFLSKHIPLPKDRVSDYISKTQRPHLLPGKQLTIIALTVFYEHQESILSTPITLFLIDKQTVITVHKRDNPIITPFEKLMLDSPSSLNNAEDFLFHLLDQMIAINFDLTEAFDDRLSFLENASFNHPTPYVMKKNYEFKRELIAIHKSLLANREVLVHIERSSIPQIANSERFRFLYTDIGQIIEIMDTYREVLTDIIEIYLTAIDTNLNDTVKRLTAWGSLILIPTLIASIYGMNFHDNSPYNMPELYWRYGYIFALLLMLGSVFLLYVFFKKKKYF
jgi:magnesium transporter